MQFMLWSLPLPLPLRAAEFWYIHQATKTIILSLFIIDLELLYQNCEQYKCVQKDLNSIIFASYEHLENLRIIVLLLAYNLFIWPSPSFLH